MTGRVIAGRYRLAEPIGRGAMGVVWRAKDQLLDRDVAIKEVRFNEALGEVERSNAYKRTLREARTAARLSHRGVVTVFDVAEEDGRPWIVMELIRSRSLDELLATDGPMPPGRVARIAQQLLSALAHAHSAGVLHRDVKPSNVLIATGGLDERAVLTDFGIAQFEGDPRLTQTGMVMGSPGFTAPERIRGGDATPASDLWSLGATIYAASEGRGPYEQRGGAITTMTAIINEDAPVAPSADRLQSVIAALLRRDPMRRPPAAVAASMIAEVLPLLPETRGGRSGTVLSQSPAAARRPPLADAVRPPAPSAPAPGPRAGSVPPPAPSGVAATGIDPPAPKAAVARAAAAAKAAEAAKAAQAAKAGAAGAAGIAALKGAAEAKGAAGAAAKVDAAPTGTPDAVDASVSEAAAAEHVGAASGSGSGPASGPDSVQEAPDAALDEVEPAEAALSEAVLSEAVLSEAVLSEAVPDKPAPDKPAPDKPAPDKPAPAKEAALAQAAASDGDSAGEPELEPTARGIPVARVPVPAKQVPDKAVTGQAGAGEPGAAPAAASSPAAGPSDTDQYAKTSLTSSGAIVAAAESKGGAASSAAGSPAGTGSAAGRNAAGSGAAGHEVTVKASTAAPASAASSGSAAPGPTVKVSTSPAAPSATVKATTPRAPSAPKPASAKPTPPPPSEKDAWWSSAYQTQGPSFSPSQNRPAAPHAPAQPGPASPFSQATQYAPPGRYTSPGRPPGPGTTPQSPQNNNYQYPAGFNPDGSDGRVRPTPPGKGSAGKKILLGILAVIVVATVVVAATILGKHHASTPNAANSSTPAGSNGPSTSASSAAGGPVPPVTRDTPTVVRAIDDHSDTVPGGYTPYPLHPSAAGTTAGFMLDVPPGWQVERQTPQRIFFNAPDGLSNVEVDLTPHTKPDMVAEAQFLKQQSVGQGKFPHYKQIELGPENVLGTRGALWRFDWTNPKTGRQMRVDDMLFVLQTPNGPQSYAIFMTAPDGNAAGSWNATILPIITNMLQSFTETTS